MLLTFLVEKGIGQTRKNNFFLLMVATTELNNVLYLKHESLE